MVRTRYLSYREFYQALEFAGVIVQSSITSFPGPSIF